MRRTPTSFRLALPCALALAACGSGSTTGDASGADVVIAPDAPTDPVATDDPGLPDPGAAVDVDAPGHPHPYWAGVTWDAIWAGKSSLSATYRVTFARDSSVQDVTAAVREGQVKQEWNSTAPWTRLAFGTLEPGNYAMALYFDHKTPWRVKVLGIDVFSPNDAEPSAQWFQAPILIPLDLPAMGAPVAIDTQVTVTAPGNDPKTIGLSLKVQAVSYASPCPSPMEAASDCAEYRVTLSGEFVGGGSKELVSQVILHPEQRIVTWSNAPGFSKAELIDLWK